MATITIAKKHAHSHRKAKDIAEKVAKELERRFQLRYVWDGDHVDFERPGVSGRMHVAHDAIRLEAHLGFLLTPLKPMLEHAIHKQLDELVDEPKTSPATAPRAAAAKTTAAKTPAAKAKKRAGKSA
jgi:putative polyhydroxyalkanoate system protein